MDKAILIYGNSWGSDAYHLPYHNWNLPYYFSDQHGFRLVRKVYAN